MAPRWALGVTNKQEVVEALNSNQVDFAFLTMPPEQIQLEKKILMSNYLFFIGASDHSFAQQKRLSQHWWNELTLDHLKIVKINDLPLEPSWKLLWRKQKVLPSVAAAFWEYVEKENEQVYQEHFAWQENYL